MAIIRRRAEHGSAQGSGVPATCRRQNTRRRAVSALIAASLLVAGTSTGSAQQAQVLADGKEDFEEHCAACHGAQAKGDGPMAEILVVPPSDLTRIAGNNDGVFPFWRVYEIIRGQQAVKGHETFQMPLMERRLRRDEGKPGFRPAYIRILTLTHYVESLQAK